MRNVVITIARSFGSGGKEIAVKLSEELGIPCYEKEILKMASDKSGISKSLFEEADSKKRGTLFNRVMKTVGEGYAVEPSDKKFTHDNNLYNIQREIIADLAQSTSCIIVGKCADYILKNRNNVVRVFIDAPMNSCVSSIRNRMGVGEQEAIRLIYKTDKYRSDYYKYYTGGREWKNPTNYDISLNSGFLGREMCVEIIKNLYEKKKAQ